MASVKKVNSRTELIPADRLGGIHQAILGDEAVNKSQMDTAIGNAIGTTIEASNNTFTGTNTFSNAAGVTTDIITERTSGNGTYMKVHAAIVTALTLAPTALTSGSTYALSKADGQTITLPALSAANIGITYKFKIITSCTSVGYVINTTGTDVFIGGIYGTIAAPNATNDALFSVSTANKTMTFGATTTCGLLGGWIEVTAISATQWQVNGLVLGTGTIATPFSN